MFRNRAGAPRASTPRPWLAALDTPPPKLPFCVHRMRPSPPRLQNITMAATYKPTDAIQLLRRATKRPLRTPRKPTARAAFSTTRPAHATQSSTPPPPPPRRSVTVTNDTGAVRWSDLSPGEKASRTVQQSMNLSVVLVGVAMTVCFPLPPPPSTILMIQPSAA